MIMLIGAAWFTANELFKAYNAETLYLIAENIKKGHLPSFINKMSPQERSSFFNMIFAETFYIIWLICGLFFYPWQIAAGIILCITLIKNFVPKSPQILRIDSIICASIMAATSIFYIISNVQNLS